MTKEELEKEAEEYLTQFYCLKQCYDIAIRECKKGERIRCGYFEVRLNCLTSFAEQVTKELQKELNYAESHCLFHSDCPTQKENAELKEKLLEQKQYTASKCNEAVKKKEVYEREHYLLTKAKELLQKCLNTYLRDPELRNEVEEFLKELENEKTKKIYSSN